MFILGCPNQVVSTDHLSLVGILNDRALEGLPNPRLLRFKEQTIRFTFRIQHSKGQLNSGSDALSRFPYRTKEEQQVDLEAIHVSCNDIASVMTQKLGQWLPSPSQPR